MKRIIILGNAGSGKSTFARQLGQALDLPVTHLDRLYWGAGWTKPDAEIFRAKVLACTTGSGWISEGNYEKRTFDLRVPRADTVIWLDTPRIRCLYRVIRRSVLNQPRPDLPDNCTERLDREFLAFLHYVWTYDRQHRPRIEARLAQCKASHLTLLRLSSDQEVRSFLQEIARQARQAPDRQR